MIGMNVVVVSTTINMIDDPATTVLLQMTRASETGGPDGWTDLSSGESYRPARHAAGRTQRLNSRFLPIARRALEHLDPSNRCLTELGVTATEPRGNWVRMATTWGHRRLDELLASDIEAMKNTATADTPAKRRRSTSHLQPSHRRRPRRPQEQPSTSGHETAPTAEHGL
jgi:hypothetical protein